MIEGLLKFDSNNNVDLSGVFIEMMIVQTYSCLCFYNTNFRLTTMDDREGY